MARATLGFAGIGPPGLTAHGPVKTSSAFEREQWIAQARADGLTLAGCDPHGKRPAARLVA